MAQGKGAQWDFVRFATTLNTFGEIPFVGSYRWLQKWLGQSKTFSGKSLNAMAKYAVVIGNIPANTLTSLDQQLSSFVTLSTWDRETSVITDKAATHATSTKRRVALCQLAKRTDTLLLWAVSDLPTLVTELADCLSKNSEVVCRTAVDFTQPTSDLDAWGALDDVVMGGVSQGTFFLKNKIQRVDQDSAQYAVFAGNVSTENSGGFSSVRTQNFEPPFNFIGWTGLRLRVKGDGQRYKFILRNRSDWDSPAYIYGFDTIAQTWIEVDVPFAEMIPTFRAKSMPDAPPFDPSQTVSLQLMLSKFEYDRQLNPRFSPGSFELGIENISAYRPRVGIPVVVAGAQDSDQRAHQQRVLAESGLHYQLIEPTQQNTVEAVSAALMSTH